MSSIRIVLRELGLNIKSLIKWIIVLVLLIFASHLLFDFLFIENEEFNHYLGLLPPIVLTLLNMSLEIDYSTAHGFLSFIFIYPTYLLVFASGFAGTRLLTREQEDQSFEFLYSRPIPRILILFLKLLTGILFCLIINLAVTLPLRHFFADLGVDALITTYMQANLLLQILALSIGALISMFFRYADTAAQYTGILLFAAVVFERVLVLAGDLGGSLWMLTLFSYFPPLELVYGYSYGLPEAARNLTIALIVGINLLILLIHLRRDFRLNN